MEEPQVDLSGAQAYVYHQIGNRQLSLHWFAPSDRRAPAVVFFHGGGWKKGTPAKLAYQCDTLAKAGIGAATVEYRLLGQGAESVWDCMADARRALRWVRKEADNLGIDPHRIAAGGGSAGAQLALSTAMIAGNDEAEDAEISCVPNLLLLFNPVTNTAPPQHWAEHFAGAGLEGSPLHAIRPGLPECLIMHGSTDTTTPLSDIKTFARAMQDAGNTCTVAPYANGEHGFYLQQPHLWATTSLLIETMARIGWIPRPEIPRPL